jgi:hypothetical protein
MLACYLLTGPHSNGLGCYRLPNGYVQADFGWSSETVSKRYGELYQIGFCERCEETSFVLIPKFLKWNPSANSKVAIAREKEFRSVPEKASIFHTLICSILKHGTHWSDEFRNHIETLSKRYAKQEPNRPEPNRTDHEPNSLSGKPDDSPKEPTLTERAEAVFNHWREVMDHPRAKFGKDDERIKKVIARLKDGYTVEDLKAAVDGCAKTPHNMGENERGQRYDGLHVICKNGDNVDRFMRTAANPDMTGFSSAARKTASAAAEWLNEDAA